MLIRSVAQYDCNGRLTRKPAPRAVLVVGHGHDYHLSDGTQGAQQEPFRTRRA
jgi:hypothetical protein